MNEPRDRPDRLDIDASLKRRGDSRQGPGEPLGEAAWALTEPGAGRVEAGIRFAPPADRQGPRPAAAGADPDDADCAPPPPPPPVPVLPGFGDDEGDEPSGAGFDIWRFVRGVWQRKWIVITVATIVTLLFLILALLLPREWKATATLITQTHQDAFQISELPPFKPQDYDLKTFVDTIKLPSSLDETMKRTGISVLRRTLAGAIDVAIGRDSKIFAIHVTWDDPVMAARIANTVAELFIENCAAIRRKDAQESFDDYSAQLREARSALEAVNAEVLAFEEKHRIASLGDQMQVLVAQVADLDAEYQTHIAEAGAMQAAMTRIGKQLEEEPEMIVTSSRYRSPLKQRLSDYQWELKEARTRYTAENPKIKRLQKRIETLEQLIGESNDEVAPENVYRLNPKREELSLRQQELVDEIKVVEAQAAAQRKTLDEARTDLAALTAARAGYQALAERKQEAERLVRNLGSRVAEVRVTMLRNESGFSILEQAAPPPLPEPSLRKLVAAAGIVLGGGLGLFIALVLEFLDPLVRTARDAAGITGCELVLEVQRAPDDAHAHVDPERPAAAAAVLFRRIVNELATALEANDWRGLAVSGAEPGSGRSLITANLAAALGLKERTALVVDADLRAEAGPRPPVLLGRPAPDGGGPAATIADVLEQRAAAADAIGPTAIHGVNLIAAGTPDNDAGLLLLGSRAFVEFAKGLRRQRMAVLYDLPPMTALESVTEAAAAIGTLLFVVRSGRTRRSDLAELAKLIEHRGIRLAGVIVTDIPEELLAGKPVFHPPEPPPKRRKDRNRKEPAIPIEVPEI